MAAIRQIVAASFTVAVALVTTAETIILSSPAIEMVSGLPRFFILAWAQLTTGTLTSAVTPRLRRGTTITSTLVGAANAEGVKVAAGGTEPFTIMGIDRPTDSDQVVYSFSLQQAAATGNGSALQGAIAVFEL